jgi:hypothetical protein
VYNIILWRGGETVKSTTFFIGAGASVDFGFADTRTFFPSAERKIHEKFKSDKPVLELFKNITGRLTEPLDIEKVLFELYDLRSFLKNFENDNSKESSYKDWLFRDSDWFTFQPGQGDAVPFKTFLNDHKTAIERLEKEVNELVYESYSKEPENPKRDCESVYQKLFKGVTRPVSIFTTNYDRCIEAALSGEEKFYDGFDDNDDNKGGVWRPELYRYNDIRLFKLHGSVNWSSRKAGDKDKIYRESRTGDSGTHEKLMIYPGFKDTPSEEPLVFMHNKLREVLLQSQICVVIGFAFRDQYINKIFADVLKENKSLKIINWRRRPPKVPPFRPIKTGKIGESVYVPFKGSFPGTRIAKLHKILAGKESSVKKEKPGAA